jgi:hypothetical protein
MWRRPYSNTYTYTYTYTYSRSYTNAYAYAYTYTHISGLLFEWYKCCYFSVYRWY